MEASLSKEPAAEEPALEADNEFLSTRPVVVEVRMECFAQSSEALEDVDDTPRYRS